MSAASAIEGGDGQAISVAVCQIHAGAAIINDRFPGDHEGVKLPVWFLIVLLGVPAFALLLARGMAPAVAAQPFVRAGCRANPFAILAQGQPDVAFIVHQRLDG